MDSLISKFFDTNLAIEHNCQARNIPAKFLNWRSDSAICEEYFNWIRTESNCDSLKLDVSTDISKMREELIQKSFLAKPHRDYESVNWKSIVLHGISSIMSDSIEFYSSNGFASSNLEYKWTDVAEFFPETVNWVVHNIPFEKFGRVRVMVLDPGGFVLPHIDYPNGQMLAGVNVAVVNPIDAEFVLNDRGRIPWVEGDSRLVDIGNFHSIRNTSSVPRIHLIVHPDPLDVWSLQSMSLVCSSYDKFKGL